MAFRVAQLLPMNTSGDLVEVVWELWADACLQEVVSGAKDAASPRKMGGCVRNNRVTDTAYAVCMMRSMRSIRFLNDRQHITQISICEPSPTISE